MPTKEQFKKIVGYENYMVSNLGNVKSLDRIQKGRYGRIYKHKGRVLKPCLAGNGYRSVWLYNKMGGKLLKISRLVAMHFIENRENKPEVNHMNGDKTCDIVDNLEWCTTQENILHACRTGLNPGRAKLNKEDVLEIKKLLQKGELHKNLAKRFGVNKQTISSINTGRSWKNVII